MSEPDPPSNPTGQPVQFPEPDEPTTPEPRPRPHNTLWFSNLASSDEALQNLLGATKPKGRKKKRGRYAALTDDEIVTENQRLRLSLRRTIALVAGALAAAQVICADVVFIVYAWKGKHWDVPTTAINAWLAATVVQVIGVVLVITRSLFPNRSGDDD